MEHQSVYNANRLHTLFPCCHGSRARECAPSRGPRRGGQLVSSRMGTACPSVPPPWRIHPALSVSFRQVLVLRSVTRTARRPSRLAGYVQRWHRQPEVLPLIDQVDTRSQKHSGMSHSCFPGSWSVRSIRDRLKIVLRTITILAVFEVKRIFLFVPLSTGLINWSFSLTGLTTFQDAMHTFPFVTRLRRRTSPSQSSRAGPLRQVQKIAARSSSHGKISSPCELD